MKVVILANDFRVYWRQRLIYLRQCLGSNNIEFKAIELFGKGSPYTFDSVSNTYDWWQCLFPDHSAAELTTEQICSAIFAALGEYMPDIVIASPITFFSGALGLRWAKQHSKKFIMFDDARPLKQFKRNFIVQGVKNLLIKQADALWLPAKDYDDEYPFVNNKYTDFFYGFSCIDNQFFSWAGQKLFNTNKIVCVARLSPVKNIDGLLRAWCIVEKQNTTIQLVIAGDGLLFNQLIQLSQDLGLKNVIFAGAKSYNSLPDLYHNADAFILPSLSETWGLVVNEAMAAGLPPLLSNKINAAQSIINDGVNGFCFDPYNVDEIAGIILKFINLGEAEKEKISAEAIKTIAGFSYERMGEQLIAELAKIEKKKFRKPGIAAKMIINRWNGSHNTSSWDNV